ncbi:MAG: nucleotidyltransferase [Bariatricus sp.]
MKIVGLITEYNPFHNGHKYHIEQALKQTDANYAVVLMSGDFVQRGAPAIMPKHLRARAALSDGASLVLELPVCCACGSAEYFARGAIEIFDALGCVDSICFGSECGDVEKLNQIARILAWEPEEFRHLLQKNLKNGLPFPAARKMALAKYTEEPALAEVLDCPNNTLGIEYLKAIRRTGSGLKACTIRRKDSGYHDTELSGSLSSASAIRRILSEMEDHSYGEPLSSLPVMLRDQIPSASLAIMEESFLKRFPVYANDLSLLLKYRLLTETRESLTQYADITPDLANRIINRRNEFISWDQFCELLKTREVTYTRISRILLHILLKIRQKDMDNSAHTTFAHYARILGFRRKDAGLFTVLHEHSRIPLITKPGTALPLSGEASAMLAQDLFASDLYESVITHKFGTPFIPSPSQPLVIL